MFGQTAANNISPAITYNITAPPQGPNGIATSLTELSAVSDNTRKLAYSVRAALGLSYPDQSGEKPVQPSTLIDVLNEIRIKLLRANEDFEMVINHINS